MLDEDSPWYKQLFVSTAVLIGVALLIAGVVTAVGVKAVDIAGNAASGTSAPESIAIPTESSTSEGPPASQNSQQSPDATSTPKTPRNEAITLSASPRRVSSLDRINLTGSYSAPDGTTLQVQREESPGVWGDFPVTTTVTGGTYATYIQTSRVGANQLRMSDPDTGAVSNVVSVKVG